MFCKISLAGRDLISLRPECKDDVKILMDMCEMDREDLANNWAVLDCVGSQTGLRKLSEKCDHYIWTVKLEVTRKEVFLNEAHKVCGEDISVCAGEPSSEPGHLLACLVEKKGETKKTECRKFLSQVENLIFSDFRIISPFLNKCEKDIGQLRCGKSQKSAGLVHSQGGTIQCLAENIEQVSGGCKKEILIIAELQSDDYHLDRALFIACKDDREQFCPQVESGQGEVYKCLMKNKMAVSQNCQDQIRRRQMIARKDYKVNAGLVRGCKEEIKASNCRRAGNAKNNYSIRDVWRQLTTDYAITLEINLYMCKGNYKILQENKKMKEWKDYPLPYGRYHWSKSEEDPV